MSTISLDCVESAALESSNVTAWDFVKDITGNRPYYVFEVPKFLIDVVSKTFSAADAVLLTTSAGFERILSTENFITLFQDVVALPGAGKSLAGKVTGYFSSSTSLTSMLHEVRRFSGRVASTVGDYALAVSSLKDLSPALSATASKIKFFSEKTGSFFSAFGSGSRIVDYFCAEAEASSSLAPSFEKVSKPIADSKKLWDLSRDVSMLAICILSIACGGYRAIPSTISIALSGSLLGSRLVSYYRDVQLREIEKSHVKMVQAKAAFKK